MTFDIDKLAKVTALMASPSDGEALSAARRADRMVREAGLSWSDVLGAGQSRTHGAPQGQAQDAPTTVKGTLTVVRESVTTKGDPMAMLTVTTTDEVHQNVIAFGSTAKWIAESVRAMPTAIFLVRLDPPRGGFRFHKVSSCVRT